MRTWNIKTDLYYSAAKYWIRGLKLSIKFPSLNVFISTMEKITVTRIVMSVQLLSHVLYLCDPMDSITLGFPVHHQLPELTQIHVYCVSDAIKPPHPLSSLFLLPSIFPCIRVFSNESVLCIRWPKYWSFTFSISPSNGYSGLISFRIDGLDLPAVQRTLKSLLLQHHCSKASILQCSISL